MPSGWHTSRGLLPLQWAALMAKKKDPNAVALGRKGGRARMRGLTEEQLTALGKKGAAARWGKKKRKDA